MPDDQSEATTPAVMPLATTLGISFPEAGPDRVRATLDWREELCTAGGLMHGGALMALGDSAGGLCAFLNLPPGAAGTTTVASSTSFLSGVRGGTVEATARPLRAGRSIAAIEVELRDQDGKLVAKMTQSQMVLKS